MPQGVAVRETRSTIELRPISGVSSTGLIFYPGGLVDAHVYVRLLARFAANGHLVIVAKMPGNFAFLDVGAAGRIRQKYAEITRWVIAGHSLGGAMAAQAVASDPSGFSGLILMDSYPPDGASLKAWGGTSLSLYSSIEKTQDAARMEKTLALLPDAAWLSSPEADYPATASGKSFHRVIEGGSHSFFGDYGPQDGDIPPTRSRDDFQAEALEYMAGYFKANGWSR